VIWLVKAGGRKPKKEKGVLYRLGSKGDIMEEAIVGLIPEMETLNSGQEVRFALTEAAKLKIDEMKSKD